MDRLAVSTSPRDSTGQQPPAAPPKRRPCDACRKRKSRCEMNDGDTACVLCKFHRQPCLFNEDPLPRKRRKVSRSNSMDKFLTTSDRGDATEDVSESDLRKASMIRRDIPIRDYSMLKGPSLLKKTLGLQSHRHSNLIGLTSELETSLLSPVPHQEKTDLPLGSRTVLRRVNEAVSFTLSPDEGSMYKDQEIRDLDEIETIVAPHGQALIHLYFRIVHPSFPVLHKKVYLEKYQRTHREFSPPLLAAVYILALNWWSYSSDLAMLPKPDTTKLERLALKTLNYIIFRPKLSTIQAGLLLLQRPQGDNWALTGKLVALGQDLGLHMDCTRWRIPSWERGLRKRLGWALYMQDKWGALVHGRPSHIMPADWMVQPLGESDFPERAADEDDEEGSTEVEKGRILFCEMIKLTEILTSILSEFYTLRANFEFQNRVQEGGRWVLEKAKPIQLRLKEWMLQLPDCLKMDNIRMRKLNSTGYLHLSYYTAEITLHRRILRALAQETDSSLVRICRTAAVARLTSASDFVRSLRADHLQSFWPSASRYGFAVIGSFITLLWVTAGSAEEAKGFKEKLDEYKWILRLESKSAEFLDQAIRSLAENAALMAVARPQYTMPDGAIAGTEVQNYGGFQLPDEDDDDDDENFEEPELDSWSVGRTPALSLRGVPGSADAGYLMQPSPTQFSDDQLDLVWPGMEAGVVYHNLQAPNTGGSNYGAGSYMGSGAMYHPGNPEYQ